MALEGLINCFNPLFGPASSFLGNYDRLSLFNTRHKFIAFWTFQALVATTALFLDGAMEAKDIATRLELAPLFHLGRTTGTWGHDYTEKLPKERAGTSKVTNDRS